MSFGNESNLEEEHNSFENEPTPDGKYLAELVDFRGVGRNKVYNTTPSVEVNGIKVILGRVEPIEDERSNVNFFEQCKDSDEKKVWKLIKEAHIFKNAQDPCFAVINGKLIVGVVEIFDKSKWGDCISIEDEELSTNGNDHIGYRTVFYEVNGINKDEIKEVVRGPEGMKDIRLVQLDEDKIAVFTRPEGKEKIEEKGKIKEIDTRWIAYTEISKMNDLTVENIYKAEKIEGLFEEGEWGGANEAFLLNNGKIGVLGHKANLDDFGNKRYSILIFVFDPKERKVEKDSMKVIQIEDIDYNEEKVESKNPIVDKVVFPCGYNKLDKTIFAGVKDSRTFIVQLHEELFKKQGGIKTKF